jgi:Flp pilus assembly protein TadG
MKVALRQTGGQALVEFALSLVILLVVLMVLFDAGRVFYWQHTITQAAREGVRTAEVRQDFTQAKYNEIRERVRSAAPGELAELVVTGEDGACPGTADATSPSTCFYPDGLAAGSKVVVNITTTINIATPLLVPFVGESFTVTARSEGYIQCAGCEPAASPEP